MVWEIVGWVCPLDVDRSKMPLCGPKLSLVGCVLSAWGVAQLVSQVIESNGKLLIWSSFILKWPLASYDLPYSKILIRPSLIKDTLWTGRSWCLWSVTYSDFSTILTESPRIAFCPNVYFILPHLFIFNFRRWWECSSGRRAWRWWRTSRSRRSTRTRRRYVVTWKPDFNRCVPAELSLDHSDQFHLHNSNYMDFSNQYIF